MTARDLQNSLLDLLMTEHMRVEETMVRVDNEGFELRGDSAEIRREKEVMAEAVSLFHEQETCIRKYATYLPAQTPIGALYQLNLIYERVEALVCKIPSGRPGIRVDAEEEDEIHRLLDSAIAFFEGMAGLDRKTLFCGRSYFEDRLPNKRALMELEKTAKRKSSKRSAA